MGRPVVLTEDSFRILKRELERIRLSHNNLLKNLHRPGVQRNQGGQSPPFRLILGKADGNISKGASGTVSIWEGPEGSETDTGRNITAYNRFAAVGSGKWVMVAVARGRAYLIAAECP